MVGLASTNRGRSPIRRRKLEFTRRRIVKSTGLSIKPHLWETVGMAEKRTKADKAQRQADKVATRSERRPEQVIGKKKVRKDSSRAA
jgi:hypothetical protein